jgi:hypothetical protein
LRFVFLADSGTPLLDLSTVIINKE